MPSNRSIISPLRIDAVTVPGTGGLIGMTICPGKDEYAGLGIPSGLWKRDLDLDLQVIRDWQAKALVTLIDLFEFARLSVPPGRGPFSRGKRMSMCGGARTVVAEEVRCSETFVAVAETIS